jgi:predicted outer membrane protein
MSWKHGVALVAAALLSAGAVAQERQPDQQQLDRARAAQQREGAEAGAQQTGAQREGQIGAQREGQTGAQREGQTGAQREGRQGQRGQRVDQGVAAMLALGNHAEIQLAQLASQKSQNPQVKEFAQQMVQEHSQFLQQLERFLPAGQLEDLRREGSSPTGARPGGAAAGARTEGAAAARTDDDRTPRATAGNQSEANPAANQLAQTEAQRAQLNQGQTQIRPGQAGEQARDPMIQIHKEAAQRALQLTKEIYNEKQGREFDRCFVGDQITMHVHMLAKLEASENHVSPELQQIVRQGQQATEQHLKQARTLAQQLEGQRGAQPGQATPGAARPGATSPGSAQPGATRPAQPNAPRTDQP